MRLFYDKLNELIAGRQPFVIVTLVDTIGSAPQEMGAKMLVTRAGLYWGTVGGGKVENRAIQEAQTMLESTPQPANRFVQWNLTSDIGMTCGGSVKYFFEVMNVETWPIVIFGAGHVAQALIQLLLTLDCRITCIDPRPDWLAKLPAHPQLETVLAEDMPARVADLPSDAFVILMTMGHTTDWPILRAILKSELENEARLFPYVGVIGSEAKAVRLRKDIQEAGLPDVCQQRFYCPIGLKLGNNHPHEIAISVAAQLLQIRDRQAHSGERLSP